MANKGFHTGRPLPRDRPAFLGRGYGEHVPGRPTYPPFLRPPTSFLPPPTSFLRRQESRGARAGHPQPPLVASPTPPPHRRGASRNARPAAAGPSLLRHQQRLPAHVIPAKAGIQRGMGGAAPNHQPPSHPPLPHPTVGALRESDHPEALEGPSRPRRERPRTHPPSSLRRASPLPHSDKGQEPRRAMDAERMLPRAKTASASSTSSARALSGLTRSTIRRPSP